MISLLYESVSSSTLIPRIIAEAEVESEVEVESDFESMMQYDRSAETVVILAVVVVQFTVFEMDALGLTTPLLALIINEPGEEQPLPFVAT